MTDTLTRRTLVKGAAWAMPVVAVAVATPLAAASEPYPPATKSKIKFNNTSSHNQGPNEVGFNTMIQVDGPEAVTGVYLRVQLKRGGAVIATKEFTFAHIGGHGNSGQVQGPFTGLPIGDGSAFTVEFFASAANADSISGVGNQPVTPNGGWR